MILDNVTRWRDIERSLMGLKEVILVVSIIIALVVAIPAIIDNHKMIKEMEEFLDQKNGRNRK